MSGPKDFTPADPSVTPRFAGIATFMRTVSHEISEDVELTASLIKKISRPHGIIFGEVKRNGEILL